MEILDLVVTVSEAEKRWSYAGNTFRKWIDEGKIKARQSGSIWLIDAVSVTLFLASRVDFSTPPDENVNSSIP